MWNASAEEGSQNGLPRRCAFSLRWRVRDAGVGKGAE
jgi:hypothetical protein